MRLRPAIPLDRYLEEPELGARPRRRARRAARQERRDQRRQNRQDRRLDRREGRQERRLQRVQQRRDRVERRLESAPARRPQARPGPRLEPAPGAPRGPGVWPEVWDAVDAWSEASEPSWDEWDELDDEAWDEHDADFEGRTRRSRAETGSWGPLVGLGRKLRIQAAIGHRAAVISLRPGLFLVAEVPEAATRAEFGAVPILAPLMVTAARRALAAPDGERRGPLSALFRRRRSEPVRQVEVYEPDGLPGPVETDYALVPAPNVGWANDATVAAADGCACGPRRR